jgi:hypothetical protein
MSVFGECDFFLTEFSDINFNLSSDEGLNISNLGFCFSDFLDV